MEKKGENRIYSIKQRKLDQHCSQMNATPIIKMQRLFEDYRKIFTIFGPIHLWDDTKGTFYLSELAGQTSHFDNEIGLFQVFLLKNHLLPDTIIYDLADLAGEF